MILKRLDKFIDVLDKEHILTDVSELFIVGINKKILIMLKSIKNICHFEIRFKPQTSALIDFCI